MKTRQKNCYKTLILTFLVSVIAAVVNAKSESPACAFLKKEKGEIVDLKKPAIHNAIEEIKLGDKAVATIKQEADSMISYAITVGRQTSSLKTTDRSVKDIKLKTATAEYELQCDL